MANFSFSSSAKLFSDEEDTNNDEGSDIEIVESEFCFEDEEKGNAFLNESIGQQNTQQQSSLQDISSDRDFLLLMEQNENALTNSFGSFGFGENAPKVLPIVGKDAGIQTQFPESFENVEADNEEKKEKQEQQCNGKMEKKTLSKLVAGFDYSNGKTLLCGWLDPETNVMNCISSHCQNDPLDVAESKALATSVKEICTQIENLLKMKTERIGRGIFAVPDQWNIGQRREFMGALKSMAGFEKIHLLNGQSAVALGFCRQKQLTKMTKNGLYFWIIKSTPRSMEMCTAQIRQNKLIILAKNEFNAFGFNFDTDKLALATFHQHFEANIVDGYVLLMGNFRIEKLESIIHDEYGIKQTQIHSISSDASSLCVNGCLYYAESINVENKNSPIQIVELLSRPIYCHYLEANTQTMLFPKFSQYPCKKKINFFSANEAQQTFQLKFYEMDKKCAITKLVENCPVEDGHNLLHNISLSLFNNDFHTFGKTFLSLCLEIDANGIFHVRIEKSGRHTSLDE